MLLVTNDHLLKGVAPSWITGKLSDLAGLVVVAVPMSVLIGLRRGLVMSGAAFVCLKVVPGVAEMSALVLGGVTRRDATDLVALLTLPVTYALLARSPADEPHRARRRVAVALSATVPWLGLAMAVVGTSATQCAPRAYVSYAAVDGSTIYVENQVSEWARSDDGGTTWRAVTQQDVPPNKLPPTPYPIDPASVSATPGGALELPTTCDASVCVRYDAETYKVERKAGSTWVVEYAGQDDSWPSPTCLGGGWAPQAPVLGSQTGPVTAVINADNHGVLVRNAQGSWTLRSVDVLGVPATGPEPSPIPPAFLIAGSILLLLLVVAAVAVLIAVGISVALNRRDRRSALR